MEASERSDFNQIDYEFDSSIRRGVLYAKLCDKVLCDISEYSAFQFKWTIFVWIVSNGQYSCMNKPV